MHTIDARCGVGRRFKAFLSEAPDQDSSPGPKCDPGNNTGLLFSGPPHHVEDVRDDPGHNQHSYHG